LGEQWWLRKKGIEAYLGEGLAGYEEKRVAWFDLVLSSKSVTPRRLRKMRIVSVPRVATRKGRGRCGRGMGYEPEEEADFESRRSYKLFFDNSF
jgi:hypothetical protein